MGEHPTRRKRSEPDKVSAKKINGNTVEAAIAEGALLVFGSLVEVLVYLVRFVTSRAKEGYS